MILKTKIKVTNFKTKMTGNAFWRHLAIGDEVEITQDTTPLVIYPGKSDIRYKATNLRTNEFYESGVGYFFNTVNTRIEYVES